MTDFWIVFNRREQFGKQPANQSLGEGITVAKAKVTGTELSPAFTGQPEDAVVMKVEGANAIKDAVRAVVRSYPGLDSGAVLAVLEGNMKEISP
jgi:hypothetical protein